MRRWGWGLAVTILALAGCSGDAEGPSTSLIIQYAPAGGFANIGDTVRATVIALDSDNHQHDPGAVTWRSEDTLIASIGTDGLITGRAHGSTRIVADAGSLTASQVFDVGGTLHRSAITTDEVWTAAAGPHLVEGVLPVGGPGGVVLTIEPGTTVIFRLDAGLDVGSGGPGRLVADGTSGLITFAGGDIGVTGGWGGLTFRGPGQSTLRHVNLKLCGGLYGTPTPCIALRDPGTGPAPTILLDSDSILGGTTAGLVLEGGARFAPGSRRLYLFGVHGLAASVPLLAAPDFPVGSEIRTNDIDEVLLVYSVGRVTQSITLGNPGAPWHLRQPLIVEGPAQPFLTIGAGASVRVDPDVSILVGQGAPGGLQIGDSTGAWVTIGDTGQRSWGGLHFYANALPSRVTRTTLRRCGTGNGGCVASSDLGGPTPALVLDSVSILEPDGLGANMLGRAGFGAGSRALQISGSNGFPMLVLTGAVSTIPSGSYTGNAADAILVASGVVTDSATWTDHGVPYLVQDLAVEGQQQPMLTLAPGVELRFGLNSQLRVGELQPGGLRILGLSGQPVTLTAQQPTTPGYWRGVLLGAMADPNSMLDYVVVDDAGAAQAGSPQAAVTVAQDLGPVVQHSTLTHSADCGIARGTGVPWTTDFTAPVLGNSFVGNAGPDQCGP